MVQKINFGLFQNHTHIEQLHPCAHFSVNVFLLSLFHVFPYRTLSCVVGWVRHILRTEQKPTDFKPDGDDMQMYSQVSLPLSTQP